LGGRGVAVVFLCDIGDTRQLRILKVNLRYLVVETIVLLPLRINNKDRPKVIHMR
jgi:hypothetical protein